MYSASTTCPACHTPCAANELICATCGLLFASYAPPTSSNTQPQTTTFTYVPLIPGQALANGRFTVRQALSKGGMGAIYLASDNEAFGRMVVVKAMLDYFDPADADAVRDARARFLQEARTLAQLRHPAIPQIFTYFQDGPHNYIVMEYIEGYDLEQQLTRRDDASGQRIDGQAYAQSDVLRWGVALCQVLVYLSSRQPHAVVHHDIKPANLLLDSSSDDIRLVDFGTAKARLLAFAGSVGLQQSSVHGTQGYAAPEQYRGQSEPRSDVYALAATLYHLATDDDPRAHPFNFPQLARLGPFGQALRAALAPDASQRPTAAQLQRQLELLAIPTSARPLQAPDGSDLADVGALAEWCEQHWQSGATWLYNQLPAQIELWWGQTKLAHDLHAIVKRYQLDTSAGLDAMLALLDPNDFGAQSPQIISNPPRLDFGLLLAKQPPVRTVTLSNPGRRYVCANAMLPDWVLAPRKTISLAPGEQQAIQLIVDRPQANNRRKLSEDILLQNGATTLLRVEARATMTRWRHIWQHRGLVAAVCLFAVLVLWPSYVQPLVRQFQSVAAAPDPNAVHYQAAVANMQHADWDRAIAEFNKLSGTYGDGAVLLQQSYYNGATVALQRGDWARARLYLSQIITYSDARKLIQATYTLEARQAGALLVVQANARRTTFGPEGRVLFTPLEGDMFELRHMPDGTLLHTIPGLHNSPVLNVAWSPDGQTLAFGYPNGLIKLTRADDGATLKIIEGRAQNGLALAWSPDGQLLACGGSALVELWGADGALHQTLAVNQHDIGVQSVAFSPDGKLLATGSDDGSIKLWRVADGTLMQQIKLGDTGIQQLIFGDQGRMLAAFDRHARLGLWRVSDGTPMYTTNLPSLSADAYAFSPDGQMIAGSNPTDHSQQITLWRVADGQVLETISLPHSVAVSISFSADGKQLAMLDNRSILTLTELKVKN